MHGADLIKRALTQRVSVRSVHHSGNQGTPQSKGGKSTVHIHLYPVIIIHYTYLRINPLYLSMIYIHYIYIHIYIYIYIYLYLHIFTYIHIYIYIYTYIHVYIYTYIYIYITYIYMFIFTYTYTYIGFPPSKVVQDFFHPDVDPARQHLHRLSAAPQRFPRLSVPGWARWSSVIETSTGQWEKRCLITCCGFWSESIILIHFGNTWGIC